MHITHNTDDEPYNNNIIMHVIQWCVSKRSENTYQGMKLSIGWNHRYNEYVYVCVVCVCVCMCNTYHYIIILYAHRYLRREKAGDIRLISGLFLLNTLWYFFIYLFFTFCFCFVLCLRVYSSLRYTGVFII